jgi:hypothetical protein
LQKMPIYSRKERAWHGLSAYDCEIYGFANLPPWQKIAIYDDSYWPASRPTIGAFGATRDQPDTGRAETGFALAGWTKHVRALETQG